MSLGAGVAGAAESSLTNDDHPEFPELFLSLVLAFLNVLVCSSPRKLMVRFQIDGEDMEPF